MSNKAAIKFYFLSSYPHYLRLIFVCGLSVASHLWLRMDLAQASSVDSHNNSAQFISAGRAGIAAAGRNVGDVFVLNPALLATKQSVEAFASYVSGANTFSENQRQIGFGMIDTSMGTWHRGAELKEAAETSRFPIASALTYTNIKNDIYRDQFFQLGLAQALSANWAVGLLLNYSQMSPRIGVNSEDQNFWDFGAGVIYRFLKRWSWGLSAQNLLDDRNEGFYAGNLMRRAIGSGLQVQVTDFFLVRADVWHTQNLNDENCWIYRFGIENNISQYVSLRAGIGKDEVWDTNLVGLGFSLLGPRLSLHYGFQRETSRDNVLHSVDLQLPFW